MVITRITLKNWRNFKAVDVNLRDRVYIIGPNASGKSNLLDVFRFLRDLSKPNGGGLQRAVVSERGGLKRVRCLNARRDPQVQVAVYVATHANAAPKWRYDLGIRSEGSGLQRPVVAWEEVEDLEQGKLLLQRPNKEDKLDPELLTETHLEQISANKEFRELAEFFSGVTYLHLVPQLLKFGDRIGGSALEGDPFGQAFLQQIARENEKVQRSRLKRIEQALQVCVPNMRQLSFERDPVNGSPHLIAQFEHWRPNAGWQRENEFSDGTLRLLAIMWSLLSGDGVLLLEEPELSLNEAIVSNIHGLIVRMQRKAKYARQVIITTHSEALLNDESIDPREVIRLEPTSNGTEVREADETDRTLIASGYTVAKAMLPRTRPAAMDQLDLFTR